MRKLLVLVVAVALVGLTAVSARAEEGSELEISGNATTVTGWQHTTGNLSLGGAGLLNDGLAAPGLVKADQFGFFVDQVELDLAKSFGENMRIRTDLDFSPNRGPAVGGVYVEQAYVTSNIPAGNGLELLVGRFNSGIGLDPIDRHELSTISFSTTHRNLLPHNLTGARFGYDFSEDTRFELYVVNNLADVGPVGPLAGTAMPSGGFNLSYAWGAEGNKNWVKYSGALGPEQATKKHYSMVGDLSANFAATDALAIGLEGTYRQDNAPTGGTNNAQFIGAQAKARYAFSDVWDGTLRYAYLWDLDSTDVGVGGTWPVGSVIPTANAISGAAGLGSNGVLHSLTLATGYQLTDGARFVLEGSVDASKFSAGGGTGYVPGLAGLFAYSF